jgi:hypothetical protein
MRQLKISTLITNRDSATIEKYFNEISKVEMITAQEEVDLARRIRQGDEAALEKMVMANLRFVVSVYILCGMVDTPVDYGCSRQAFQNCKNTSQQNRRFIKN